MGIRIADEGPQVLITIDGSQYPTVSDAARQLGVSTKAVDDYIKKGVIPRPPTIEYGLRDVNIYPPDYMDSARAKIRDYRRQMKIARSRRTETGS